jgi:integrase
LQVHVGIQEARAQKEGKLVHSYILAEPKTASSRRHIPLSKLALVALQVHREEQHKQRFAVGRAWRSDLNLVFPNLLGGIMDPHYFQKRFYALLERADLPRIRFHDLRHTAATLLLKRGVHPKIVSELLGHTSIKITLDLYSHVIPDMQGVVTTVMDAIFARSAS